MRLLLGVTEDSARSHFLNGLMVCPTNSEYDVVKLTDVVSLDIVDDAECEEIVVDHLHEYVPPHFFHQFITNLLRKGAAGCLFTFIGTDIRKVAHSIINNQLETDQTNMLLYGNVDYTNPETAKIPPKRTILSAIELKEVMDACGMPVPIEHIFVDKHTYILRYTR